MSSRTEMTVCETCGYEIREDVTHRSDGDGHCQILDAKTGVLRGVARRRQPKDLYAKRK